VNQLARQEPGEVRALLRSGEELRKEQQRALEGKGAADLQKRLDGQRRAVRALARLGRDILVDEGRSVSDAIVERIGKTLDAAALDEGSRALLRAGRLKEELEPPGFEALAGMTPTAAPRKRPAADKRGAVAEARKRVTESKSEARARDREALRAEREAVRADQAAADARRVAEEARARADDAERALAEAEAALRAAQRR
jgi:hypothetical protein